MGRYDFDIDLSNKNTTYTRLIQWTGRDKNVLEIGCYRGQMSRYLKENQCRVTGIELDNIAGRDAEKFCDKFIEGNIESEDILIRLDDCYDVIIFGDVLEHLVLPELLLRKLKSKLSPDGYILISLPNIGYWSVRRNLLFGKFDYQEFGILDRTHLHFYTFDSISQLLVQSGYRIEQWVAIPNYNWFDYTFHIARKLYRRDSCRKILNKLDLILSRLFPKLFGYQFVLKIKPVK